MQSGMNKFSQRRVFTTLFTALATLSGTFYGVYELHDEADRISDIVKISTLLAITSFVASYIFWTLCHLKKDSALRGGLAGLLTGLAIVPVPFFTSSLKAELLRIHKADNTEIIMPILKAVALSLKNGLETFQIISKVSLVAVISSAVLGVIIAKRVPPRLAETSSNPND